LNTEQLVQEIVERSAEKPRFIVAIAGPPGAGKSTLAETLAEQLNRLGISHSVVPMDGFHLDNTLLDERGLRHRKGAADTFDAHGFVHLIKRLSAQTDDVFVPIFDRTQDQSIACAQRVATSDQIILVEGNYLLLDVMPWVQLHDYWDMSIFVDPGIETLEKRLVDRWVQHDHDPDAARERAMQNDLPNAQHVLEHSSTADAVHLSGAQ